MSGLSLLPFQVRASQQIVHRYFKLVNDPERPMITASRAVPYYQALSALTGAGKTPILADSVSQIRASMSVQPLVLWISKAKAVVDQTFANMEPGGKYNHLIDPFVVTYLSDLSPSQIADGGAAFIALATVGSFTRRDKSDGTLKVHTVSEDSGDLSLWEALADRKDSESERRPLIIVYDEGHNLTDTQVDLLLELDPDAILVASATMRTPGRLGRMIERLRESGWTDEPLNDDSDLVRSSLVTAVNSRAVVDAGLVKKQVVIGGYTSIMETMIDDLLAAMDVARSKAGDLQAGFEPKAIYVCKTNISQDDGTQDVASRPFQERRAPPILIWRHLVEHRGIDPRDIAVYCDLQVDRRDNPLPPEFKLFSGGEDDFAVFSAGDYHHIIFNQALQEGWDDPSCCFAYVDKSMGSSVQVEQVIGRVLRQPGARHYADADLNTANFFIRVDDRQEFPRILRSVQQKLGAEVPGVHIEGYSDPRDRQRARQEPKQFLTVPEIHIDADAAIEALEAALRAINDYRHDSVNTVGTGLLTRAVQMVGETTRSAVETLNLAHSNRVTARWIVRRAMMALHSEAAKAVDWSDGRFDAKVEITSPAATVLRAVAEQLVDRYLENSDLVFEEENPYTVGPVLSNPVKARPFSNALHASYELNALEQEIAESIDETGLVWVRNPENGGYSIPLLDKGDTRRFYPDFLVWKDDRVFAVDPKGGHLLASDAWRKLLDIRDERGRQKVMVRLISEGKWNDDASKHGPSGYTVWSATKSTGKPRARHVGTVAEAVALSLKP